MYPMKIFKYLYALSDCTLVNSSHLSNRKAEINQFFLISHLFLLLQWNGEFILYLLVG